MSLSFNKPSILVIISALVLRVTSLFPNNVLCSEFQRVSRLLSISSSFYEAFHHVYLWSFAVVGTPLIFHRFLGSASEWASDQCFFCHSKEVNAPNICIICRLYYPSTLGDTWLSKALCSPRCVSPISSVDRVGLAEVRQRSHSSRFPHTAQHF